MGSSPELEISEWSWSECRAVNGRWSSVLHHVPMNVRTAALYMDYDLSDVTTSCGAFKAMVVPPGILTRMGLRRCAYCSRALGYPRGMGSPKNDPACRPLVQARIDRWAGA